MGAGGVGSSGETRAGRRSWGLGTFFLPWNGMLTQRPADAGEVGVEAGSVWLKQEVLTGLEAGR